MRFVAVSSFEHGIDLPVGLIEGAVSPDHKVRAGDLLLGGPLCVETLACGVGGQPALDEARQLHRRRAVGDDDAVEVLLRARLEQERDIHDRERTVADLLEAAEAGRDRAVDGGVHDGFEVAPRRHVSEHDRAKLAAIDGSIRRQDVGAEALGDRRCRLGARRGHAVRELVGVEARHAAPTEALEHVALPRRNSAGQGYFDHRIADLGLRISDCGLRIAGRATYPTHLPYPPIPARSRAAASVFLSSIAIVSGPTPPGTGDSAPATSATSGCTSPTVSDPRRSNASRRFEPARKQPLHRRAIAHVRRPHSHDCRARLHEGGRHETRTADRRDEDVRLRRHPRQIHGPRVTDRHRRVPVQQQQRHRLADDVAAADDDGAHAGHRNLRSLEQLDDARRRAGDKARTILDQPADVQRVKAVDVLVWQQRVEHPPLGVSAHRGRQRRLDEDAVVHVAPVQAIDNREHLVERCGRRQPLEIRAQPRLARRLQLAPDVHLRRRIVADEHDAEAGRTSRATRERRDRRSELRANPARDGRAVEHSGGHQCATPASPSSRFSASGRPSTTSRSPACIVVSGSGLNASFFSPW